MNPTGEQIVAGAQAAYAVTRPEDSTPWENQPERLVMLWERIARAVIETLPLLTLEELVAELRKTPEPEPVDGRPDVGGHSQGAIKVRRAEGARAPYPGVTSQEQLDSLLEHASGSLRQRAQEYSARRAVVTARFVTFDTAERIAAWCGGAYNSRSAWPYIEWLANEKTGEVGTAHIGEWVVRRADGTFKSYDAKEFDRSFRYAVADAALTQPPTTEPSGYAIRYTMNDGDDIAATFLGGAVYGTPEEAEKARVTLGTYTTVVGIVKMK